MASAYVASLLSQSPVHLWMASGRSAADAGSVPASASYGTSTSEVLGTIQGEAAIKFVGRTIGASQSWMQANPLAVTGPHAVEVLFKLGQALGANNNGWYLFGTRPASGVIGSGGVGGTEMVVTSTGRLRFLASDGAAAYQSLAPADPNWTLKSGQPADWMKVEVTTGGTCQFINTVFAGGGSWGALYDNAGALVVSDVVGASGGRFTFTPTLAAGIYWLVIQPATTGRNGWIVRANPGTAVLATPSAPYAVPFSAPHTAVALPPNTNVGGVLSDGTQAQEYGPVMDPTVWHQAALNINSVSGKNWELYLDGAQIASGVHALGSGIQLFVPTNAPLTVGNYSRGFDSNWTYEGLISHLSAFIGLDAPSVAAHYAAMQGSLASMLTGDALMQALIPTRVMGAGLAPCPGGGGSGAPTRPLVGQTWPRG